jgi:acetylornithine deacetylase/succinyl-diaminopimelate desuccinylase-like protein
MESKNCKESYPVSFDIEGCEDAHEEVPHIDRLRLGIGGPDAVQVVRRTEGLDEEHPPRIEWLLGGVPPAAIDAGEPIVRTLLGAHGDVRGDARLEGFDNWHDGATLITEGGIPAVVYGPGDIQLAHAVDERVPVDELVACAQGIAVAAMRFCGVE